jgi:hypothetical protein
MGRTNTNVTEHFCSRCRNRRPIHDFPYPQEVWWCRVCWRVFRVRQNEARKQRRQLALEDYMGRPRSRGWSVQPYRSKGTFGKLSPWVQSLVREKHNSLIGECIRQGRPLTPQKIASLKGNAVFSVLYADTGKVRAWTGNHGKRVKRWRRLQEKRKVDQFRDKPAWQRRKYLDIF